MPAGGLGHWHDTLSGGRGTGRRRWDHEPILATSASDSSKLA